MPEAAEIVSRGRADVVVRINRPLRMAVRDIEASVGPGVLALALPKTDSAEHVRLIAETVDEVEAERGMPPGATRLIAMAETATRSFIWSCSPSPIRGFAHLPSAPRISPPRPASWPNPRR